MDANRGLRIALACTWLVAVAACAGAHTDTSAGATGSAGSGGASSVAGLPLVEVPAARPGHALAVVLSGDGNWADIDRAVARTLSDSGVAVVGLRSRSYLQGGQRTPLVLADDVTRLLRHYMAAWQRDSVVIVGYSRGADFAPFVANRLPADLRDRLVLVAMLALAHSASFQFHWSDLVRDTKRVTDIPTLPEVARLRGVHLLCIYGREEEESGCRDVDTTAVRAIERGGGHHFDGDYRALGVLVLDALREW